MSKLVILFPGIGYNCDKPLLYYGRKLAEQEGYECRMVPYVYDGDARIRGDRERMKKAFESLYAQAAEMLSGVEYGQYEEVLFLSKSVGTVIAAAYAKELREKGILPGAGFWLRHVLYTPLEYTFQYEPENAVGFLGTADPWCVPEEVFRLAKKQGVPMHAYEGANHSLETADTFANLRVLADIMTKTKEFLQKKRGG